MVCRRPRLLCRCRGPTTCCAVLRTGLTCRAVWLGLRCEDALRSSSGLTSLSSTWKATPHDVSELPRPEQLLGYDVPCAADLSTNRADSGPPAVSSLHPASLTSLLGRPKSHLPSLPHQSRYPCASRQPATRERLCLPVPTPCPQDCAVWMQNPDNLWLGGNDNLLVLVNTGSGDRTRCL